MDSQANAPALFVAAEGVTQGDEPLCDNDSTTHPRGCSECGAALVKKPGPGRWPLVCGPECRADRNRRLAKPYVKREQRCRRCGIIVASHANYCDECRPINESERAARYLSTARKKQQERRAKFGRELTPSERRRREWCEQGCSVCGLYVYGVIDAHHVNPSDKAYNIKTITDVAVLDAELSKCRPLCANHHRIVHGAMRNGGSGLAWPALVEYVRIKYADTLPTPGVRKK